MGRKQSVLHLPLPRSLEEAEDCLLEVDLDMVRPSLGSMVVATDPAEEEVASTGIFLRRMVSAEAAAAVVAVALPEQAEAEGRRRPWLLLALPSPPAGEP